MRAEIVQSRAQIPPILILRFWSYITALSRPCSVKGHLNMFNLVESMSIRGLFTLLKQQMARTEELHKKLEEKTREIIRLQEQLNTHVKFTPRDLPEDQDVVQLSPADPS